MKGLLETYEPSQVPEKHPSLFELKTVMLGIFLAVLGIIIGLELLTRVGITPNTSIIAAIIAIGVSRIPIQMLGSFREVTRQNLMQTIISGATYGGANAIFLPMGILWLLGRSDLVPAMLIGAVLGLVIDATILYRVFDSQVYPANETWPPGIATAECIIAGNRGGRRAGLLGIGGILGILGRGMGIPMDIFGVCWIGNIWALTMFGLGLLVRGYAPVVLGVDINEIYIPHGMMIGAGSMALLQISLMVLRNENQKDEKQRFSISKKQFGGTIGIGFLAFVIAAALLAGIAGLYVRMSLPMLIGFVMFAGTGALVSELIIGIAAMHAGWFPSFATALLFLIGGMLIGFPEVPLALLVGFTVSTGPAFADMAYDLKAGWILRGSNRFPRFEKQGRRQQFYAELLGFTVALMVVALFHERYFSADLFPPVNRVYVATIRAGVRPEVGRFLVMWAVPGAIIQLVGGMKRQLGILFATGLLVLNPAAGWTALVALTIRAIVVKRYGKSVESLMYPLAGGFIAGSALCSFGTATLKGR
jgi:uncharacterized oligopeptide transporter (OPT) family protein